MQPYSIEPLVPEDAGTGWSWKKRVLVVVVCLGFFVVTAWNVGSSEWFLQKVLLPRIGESINGTITVQSADWSLNNLMILRGVTIKASGHQPCFKAQELRLRYSLKDFISGDVSFHGVKVVKPDVFVKMDSKGETNLDPFFRVSKKETGALPLVHLGKIEVFGGRVFFTRQFSNGTKENIIGSNFQIQAEEFGNDLTEGALNLSTGFRYVEQFNDDTLNSIEGTLSIKTELVFSRDWNPLRLASKAKARIFQTSDQFDYAQNLEIDWDSLIQPNSIERLSIFLNRGDDRMGSLTVRGPMDLEEGSAQLEVGMHGVDHELMNLVGRKVKLDFQSTVLNSTNQLSLSEFGKVIRFSGSVHSKPFHVNYGRMTMPLLEELNADYSVQVDFAANRADISRFQLVGRNNDRKLMDGKLEKPMILSWAEKEIEAPDSKLKISLTDIDATEWEPWIGRYVSKGRANLKVDMMTERAGRHIEFILSGDGTDIEVPVNDQGITVGKLEVKSVGELENFKTLTVKSLTARLGSKSDPVLSVSWPFLMDFDRKSASGKLVASGQLPVLSAWVPNIGVNCKRGVFDCNGSLGLKFGDLNQQNFEGELSLRNFTGGGSKYSVTNLTTRAIFKASLNDGSRLKIESLNAAANIASDTLMTQFYVTGIYDFRGGTFHLDNLTLKEVDLDLVNQVVSLGVLRGGKADASLQIKHSRDQDTKTSLIGSISLFKGVITDWSEPVNAKLSEVDVNLLWGKKEQFKTVINHFHLAALNRQDLNSEDALVIGSIEEYNPFTGRLKCTLNKTEISHTLLRQLIAKQLGSADLASGRVSNSKPLKVDINENGTIQILGHLNGENIVFDAPNLRLPAQPLGFEVGMKINYLHQNSNWSINSETANVTFTLGDQKIGGVSSVGKYESEIEKGDFKITINDLDYKVLNLLPDTVLKGFRMNAGRVDRLEANATISNGEISGRLGASIKGLNFNRSNGFWPAGPLDMEHSFEGIIGLGTFSGEEVIISFDNISGSIMQNENPIAQYDVNGSIKGEDFHINIRSMDLGPEIATAALAKWKFNKEIRSGQISVRQAELAFPKLGSSKFSGGIELKGFELKSKASDKPSMNLDSRFKIDAVGKDRIFHIKNFVASIPRTERAANQLMVTGAIDLTDIMKPVLSLKLNSDALDIDPIMGLVNENTLVSKSGLENTSNQTSKDRFALKRLLVDLDIKRLFWSDLNAVEVAGRVRMEGRKIELLPLQMRLLKSPVMIEGFIIPGSGYNISYDLNISCQNLALDPVINHFHPENEVKWGRLTAKLRAKGDALSGELFRRTFTAGGIDPELPATLKIEGSHWAFKEDGFITSVIATVLRMPDLLESHFNSAELDLRVKEEKAELKFLMAGPLIRLKAEGDGQMSDRIIDTSVDQKVEVELAAKTYKYNVLLTEKDGFVKLPSFINIKGPLSDPEYETDKAMITGILTGTILAVPVKLPFQLLRILPFID